MDFDRAGRPARASPKRRARFGRLEACQAVEAFEAQEGRWLRVGAWTDGDTPRVAPFDATLLDVAGLFLPLMP